MSDPNEIDDLIAQVDIEKLRNYTGNIAGFRHGWENPAELALRAVFLEKTLESFGLTVERREVPFQGRIYRNIVGTIPGKTQKPMILVGAHYDAALGSPGADDNASGIAVLLESSRILATLELDGTIQFVAFTLEEPQPGTLRNSSLVGSTHFAKAARRNKDRYQGVIILESVGYSSGKANSQAIPPLVSARVPDTGDFLGIVANQASESVLDTFSRAAREWVPDLKTIGYKVPLSGYLVPQTRFSDHAPFWDQGYPALMLTDTAMFRNPNYHTPHDSIETLDFSLMSEVTRLVLAACCLLQKEV